MPPLWDVTERLGLDPESTEVIARYKALSFWGAFTELEPGGHDAHGQAERVSYLTTQGFRVLGLLALFDQQEARVLGEKFAWRLG